jgi:hypothetical protein
VIWLPGQPELLIAAASSGTAKPAMGHCRVMAGVWRTKCQMCRQDAASKVGLSKRCNGEAIGADHVWVNRFSKLAKRLGCLSHLLASSSRCTLRGSG